MGSILLRKDNILRGYPPVNPKTGCRKAGRFGKEGGIPGTEVNYRHLAGQTGEKPFGIRSGEFPVFIGCERPGPAVEYLQRVDIFTPKTIERVGAQGRSASVFLCGQRGGCFLLRRHRRRV